MSRAETANRLTISAVDKRVDAWAEQVKRLHSMGEEVSQGIAALTERKSQTTDEMALALMPIAEAMALLMEETRQTLMHIVSQSQKGHAQAVESVRVSVATANTAITEIRTAMLRSAAILERLEAVERDERNRPAPNIWGPALVAALIPTAAVSLLAWKTGFLSF